MLSRFTPSIFLLFYFLLAISCNNNSSEFPENNVTDKATKSWEAEEAALQVNELRNLYFGDLHVHTSLSVDAYIGGTLNNPDQAYRFGQGESVEVLGRKIKLKRPLDFSAVTDHAEMIGEMFSVQTPGAPGYKSILAKYLRSIYKTDSELGVDTARQRKLFNRVMKRAGKNEPQHPGLLFEGFSTTKSAWEIILQAAENHYHPGRFTTLAGYEWTFGGGFTHMHRNIIFRDMMVPDYPMSSLELRDELSLWTWLDSISQKGATVLAIPHNSNLSNGGTFSDSYPNGDPIDSSYAQLRQDYEPLVEVHQAKGNSEVHAAFWKNDEFADFENHTSHTPMKNNYVRYALKKGLEYEEHLGVNPFKLGMIGSTDTHNGTPGDTDEDEFTGNAAVQDCNADARRNMDMALSPHLKVYEVLNPGGLVAVWAEANTRGHIYDALKRKETYATSGTRISLRLFAGYGFSGDYNSHEDLLKDGYDKGVPMGRDIQKNTGVAPELLVWALKDPLYAPLDRIQVIKGWYKEGKVHEKIFDVALSDNRQLNPDGTVPDNKASVDMTTGEWAKDKGNAELMTVWKDPEFDKDVRAFYYVRVLEIPTASWRLWDQIRTGIPYPNNAELTIQERAWSSPVWYSPE